MHEDAATTAFPEQALTRSIDDPAATIAAKPVPHGDGIAPPLPLPPAIGKYRIIRLLGEGGMGAVYEAEQDQPRRRVALKVIKAAFAGQELLRRFELESQTLGRLHHPGIAQIYEAGSAAMGLGSQPFFAMELIQGEPLCRFAESRKLDLQQRLLLMMQICDAVEHAHQRGIIHRDLKPLNILVDERGQTKILDFGLALVTDSDVEATRQTDVGALLGTLAYMSPEQVTGDPDAMDERSDVYSLGVVLYELLSGQMPYQLSRQLHEAVQTIQQSDPHRLSMVNRLYRGDIETIVGKALEKDKARRYQSSAELSADIGRYLANQPIAAKPASTAYQLRKFTVRHKGLVTAAAIVTLVLLGGTIISTLQAIRARRAESAAQAVSDFLQNDLLAQASAYSQSGALGKPDPEIKVRTALDRAAAHIEGKFGSQPAVEAAVRGTIGRTYKDLGLYPEARKQLQAALELSLRTLGPKSAKTLAIQADLLEMDTAGGDLAKAEVQLTQLVKTSQSTSGSESADTLKYMRDLSNVYALESKFPQAEALDRQNLDTSRRTFGPEALQTLAAEKALALDYQDLGKYPDAETLLQHVLESDRRLLGPEHPRTVSDMHDLGQNEESAGKLSEAEGVLGKAVEISQRILGPEHRTTMQCMGALAGVYRNQGKFEQAAAIDRQLLDTARRVFTAEQLWTSDYIGTLGVDYGMAGKYRLAEPLLTEAAEVDRRQYGPDNLKTLAALTSLAMTEDGLGKDAEAESLHVKLAVVARRSLGPENPATLTILSSAADSFQQHAKFATAESYAAEALTGRHHALGNEDPDTTQSEVDLALAYVSQGKFGAAEPLARQALESDKKIEPDDWQRYRAASVLGESLAGQKKYAEAEPLLVEGYRGMLARKARIDGPDLYHLQRGREWLLRMYRDWGKPAKATEWTKL